MATRSYVVRVGDTLMGIVTRECPHVSWQAVADLNQLRNAHLIYPGQVIKLPIQAGENTVENEETGSIIYTVQAGDTLGSIVERFCPGKSYQEVARENNIADPNIIQVGQQITLNCSSSGNINQQGGGLIETSEGAAWLENVPFVSQEGPGANKSGTDCGPTALRMVIGWNRLRQGQSDNTTTVNDVWDTVVQVRAQHFPGRTPLVPGGFTFLDELIVTGSKYGLNLQLNSHANIQRIKQEIDAQRPAIALVCYGSFNNFEVAFRGGHFVTVIGYTPLHVIIHDPIGWRGAKNWHVPNDVFDSALRHAGTRCTTPGNPDYSAIFVR